MYDIQLTSSYGMRIIHTTFFPRSGVAIWLSTMKPNVIINILFANFNSRRPSLRNHIDQGEKIKGIMCSEVGVLEGFICPICFQDLGSLYNLTDHFELTHNSEEDKALLFQIKGIFGKAKKKLLRKDDFFEASSTPSTTSVAKSTSTLKHFKEQLTFEPQQLGVTRSHTDFFKSSRDRRIDRFVIETNKILIRLDKLLNIDSSLDSSKRKTQEKDIVSWASDKDVNLCMTCGRSFLLTRRRHHCRLCGRIICHKCSNFLPYDFARKMTSSPASYEGEGFHRSSSTSSLNSTVGAEGYLHLRTCQDCRFLLERRQEQINLQTCKPNVVLLYEKLREFMSEAESLLPEYSKMADSLRCDHYPFQTYIICLLDCSVCLNRMRTDANCQSDSTSKHVRLQQMISVYATSFVQDNLLGLPKLPTESELKKLREARKVEAQRRIAEERKIEQERMKRMEEERIQQQLRRLKQQQTSKDEITSKGHRRSKSSEGVSALHANMTSPNSKLVSGLVSNVVDRKENCDNVTFLATKSNENAVRYDPRNEDDTKDKQKDNGKSSFENDVEPILQQIEIIKRYLVQAEDDGRWDEVRMLQENLFELRQECKKIQNNKR
ncbi:hypothetical protein HELRODRAFT_167891 [Helobdella robusta]|uniref:FYVE-type domain-containing protein n=1 Tax=Helobdella robusta TaxID=6412 RepID=T1EZX5_HELRO|nr:hypothetical protein HELRODRAFT_167891 [Helobdella robusta]ESO10047.1 hypothetical protein HELRODRAFT_167891 [Helobdella robusta]